MRLGACDSDGHGERETAVTAPTRWETIKMSGTLSTARCGVSLTYSWALLRVAFSGGTRREHNAKAN